MDNRFKITADDLSEELRQRLNVGPIAEPLKQLRKDIVRRAVQINGVPLKLDPPKTDNDQGLKEHITVTLQAANWSADNIKDFFIYYCQNPQYPIATLVSRGGKRDLENLDSSILISTPENRVVHPNDEDNEDKMTKNLRVENGQVLFETAISREHSHFRIKDPESNNSFGSFTANVIATCVLVPGKGFEFSNLTTDSELVHDLIKRGIDNKPVDNLNFFKKPEYSDDYEINYNHQPETKFEVTREELEKARPTIGGMIKTTTVLDSPEIKPEASLRTLRLDIARHSVRFNGKEIQTINGKPISDLGNSATISDQEFEAFLRKTLKDQNKFTDKQIDQILRFYSQDPAYASVMLYRSLSTDNLVIGGPQKHSCDIYVRDGEVYFSTQASHYETITRQNGNMDMSVQMPEEVNSEFKLTDTGFKFVKLTTNSPKHNELLERFKADQPIHDSNFFSKPAVRVVPQQPVKAAPPPSLFSRFLTQVANFGKAIVSGFKSLFGKSSSPVVAKAVQPEKQKQAPANAAVEAARERLAAKAKVEHAAKLGSSARLDATFHQLHQPLDPILEGDENEEDEKNRDTSRNSAVPPVIVPPTPVVPVDQQREEKEKDETEGEGEHQGEEEGAPPAGHP